jgi:hypothetical protein
LAGKKYRKRKRAASALDTNTGCYLKGYMNGIFWFHMPKLVGRNPRFYSLGFACQEGHD